MMLLKILRPADIPNRKTNWGYRVRFYHWLLLRLLPVYRKSAISDTLNLGETQIIHNVRDYWYEQELQRFHIDTAQHLERQNAPYNLKSKYRRSPLFNWSESLLVFQNGKSYNIKRSNIFSIETELAGQLKVSGAKDFILRSEFVAKIAKPQRCSANEDGLAEHLENERKYPTRQRISVKDNIPTSPHNVEPSEETVKYRGFEENNIF
jgi:hypothetical protein